MRENRRSPRFGRVVIIVFGGLLFLGGLAFAAVAVRDIVESRALQTGRTATGVVQSITPTMWSSGGRSRRTVYGFDVVFTFEAEGRAVTSRRYGIRRFESSSAGERDAVAARYSPGTSVSVYYQAGRPERAVIDPVLPSLVPLQLSFGAWFGVLGMSMVCMVRTPKYFDPHLPLGVRREGHEFVLEPMHVPAALTIGLIGLSLAVMSAGAMMSMRAAPPLAWIVVPTGVIVLMGVILPVMAIRRKHSRRGAVIVDEGAQTVSMVPWFAGQSVLWRFEDVLGAELAFRPTKGSRTPNAKHAHFQPVLQVRASTGTASKVRLSNHTMSKADAHEWLAWFNDVLVLGDVSASTLATASPTPAPSTGI